uniref:Glucosamine inositolphosphorylceramide transferase 1 N-terminal domain-containing protein n=1 Tax=Desulfomonile tiedjei TaxID=2358 RepID=A0A7C4ETA3_9BACT
MHKAPLKICILCQDDSVPLWVAKALEKLVTEDVVQISLVAIPRGPVPGITEESLSTVSGCVPPWRFALYRLYRFLSALCSRTQDTASKPTAISHLCRGASRVFIRLIRIHGRLEVVAEDLASFQERNLDVVLCCGNAPVNLGSPNIAAHGAWYVEDPWDPYVTDSEAGTWEFVGDYPILKMEIRRRLDPKSPPQALCRSFLPSYVRDGLWAFRGIRDVKLWAASAWLYRLIQRLHTVGATALAEPAPPKTLDAPVPQAPQFPHNKQMAAVLLKKVRRTCKRVLRRNKNFDEWQIAYRFDDRGILGALDGGGFSRLVPPNGFFWADPLPVRCGDNYLIFIEELPYESGKGHLSVIQVDARGGCTPPVKVLERPYHLSYPFVFEWEGDYYMVPETASNKTVELYKAESYPFEWSFQKVLLANITAVDSTLAYMDATWWLFAATMPYEELNDDNFMELNIFYAKTPYGPWRAHPKNPVKSDARNSRPAGGIAASHGKLLRPAQDCLRAYGHAISINEIERLTVDEFSEREVARILPSEFGGAQRIHTIGRCEGLTVVDLAFNVRDA